MNITSTHPEFDAAFTRRAVAWIARELGVPRGGLRRWSITVRQRRTRSYSGRCYYYERRVVCSIRAGITSPVSVAHNREEREREMEAADGVEVFVKLMAHELEHARAMIVSSGDPGMMRRLNHEPRVRAIDYRIMLRFRAQREELLVAWRCEAEPAVESAAPAPSKSRPGLVERRAAKAAAMLAAWERRLKMAKTKAAKYRRRVAYYQRRRQAAGGAA